MVIFHKKEREWEGGRGRGEGGRGEEKRGRGEERGATSPGRTQGCYASQKLIRNWLFLMKKTSGFLKIAFLIYATA